MEVQFKRYATKDGKELLGMMEDFYKIDGYPFDRTTAERNITEFTKTDDLGRLFIIESSYETIGYVILAFGFSFEFKGRNAFIDELYIKDAYRKQGIGKQAMIFLEEEAVKLNLKTLHMEVEMHNTNAKNLYLNHGFSYNQRTLLTKYIQRD